MLLTNLLTLQEPVNWLTSGFVYPILSLIKLTYRLQTIAKTLASELVSNPMILNKERCIEDYITAQVIISNSTNPINEMFIDINSLKIQLFSVLNNCWQTD